jgi:hypothetical protein
MRSVWPFLWWYQVWNSASLHPPTDHIHFYLKICCRFRNLPEGFQIGRVKTWSNFFVSIQYCIVKKSFVSTIREKEMTFIVDQHAKNVQLLNADASKCKTWSLEKPRKLACHLANSCPEWEYQPGLNKVGELLNSRLTWLHCSPTPRLRSTHIFLLPFPTHRWKNKIKKVQQDVQMYTWTTGCIGAPEHWFCYVKLNSLELNGYRGSSLMLFNDA